MGDGIRLVEESFRLHALGQATLLPRMVVGVGGDAGSFRVMSSSIPHTVCFGLKTLTGVPGKRHPGNTYSVILVFDAITGALLGMPPASNLTSSNWWCWEHHQHSR